MNKSKDIPKAVLAYYRVITSSIQFIISTLFLKFTLRKPLTCKNSYVNNITSLKSEKSLQENQNQSEIFV